MGDAGVVNIEREVNLGDLTQQGRTHPQWLSPSCLCPGEAFSAERQPVY